MKLVHSEPNYKAPKFLACIAHAQPYKMHAVHALKMIKSKRTKGSISIRVMSVDVPYMGICSHCTKRFRSAHLFPWLYIGMHLNLLLSIVLKGSGQLIFCYWVALEFAALKSKLQVSL